MSSIKHLFGAIVLALVLTVSPVLASADAASAPPSGPSEVCEPLSCAGGDDSCMDISMTIEINIGVFTGSAEVTIYCKEA